ncbi:MAG: type II toxin-antitoxin system HigB family toxin [Tannerellaceae bacterium]|jgi:mRNA interferase HigB|nr:type II toxin-antitoxin system HigB family toxin [Tannerellaceae bacterium]
MRILTEKALKDYIKEHPDAETALQEWIKVIKNSEWTCFADIKESFNSVDNVGNQRYVFNIRGNNHRLIVIIRFTIQYVYIRFIGTHKEYDLLDSNTIKNI